jgi:tetratricopeptide (TPR) repeat protein
VSEGNRMKLKLLFLVIAVFLVAPAFAADDLDTFTRRLATAKDRGEEVEIYKMMGDYHAKRHVYEKAAEAYVKALPDLRNRVTEDEMTQVAVYLSWGGKLKAAETELHALLQKNPANVRARAQLSQVLLWSNDLNGALSEAETVLAKISDDRKALLVKAEVLRYKGEVDRAIVIYKELLERADDFDSRIGLSYAHLEKGDLDQAKTVSSQLRPEYPYQKQELEKLHIELKKPPVTISKHDTLKAEGDRFAAANDYKTAAVKYEEALALSRNFPLDQWLRMATVMSWGGKHKEARHELEAILAQAPSNLPARLQFARVLLWMSAMDAAIREADTILAFQPGNRDAILVKADALRRKGFYRDADRLYKSLLIEKEAFDVREGQTYSYLTGGNRLKTDESMVLLKPHYLYEQKEMERLHIDRDWAFRPRLYGGVTFYNDKDDNEVTTYSAGTQFWLGNWKTNLDYSHVSARAPGLSNESDNVQLSTYSRMPWYGGIGGGVGLAQGGIMTWKALADFDVLYGSVGLLAAREAYSNTAELVEKDIRALILSASIIQRPTDRITLSGSYSYRDYSDDNSSHDVQASAAYLFLRIPAISAGYRFRYLDFHRQSYGGYFDPDNFIANSVFVNLSFWTNRVYGYLEPYIGYQIFDRYGESRSETFYGAAGSLGYRVTDRIAIEGNAEWGNYAGSGVAAGGEEGWYYGQIGVRFIILL